MSSEAANLTFLLSSTLVYTAFKKKKKNLITSKKFPSKSCFFPLTRTLCHIYFRNIFRLLHFVYKSALIFWPLVYSCLLPFCSSLKWKKGTQRHWLPTALWQLAALRGVSLHCVAVTGRPREGGGQQGWSFCVCL